MKSILDWFEHRTGYREFIHTALYEPVPGGARWRYVWGSTLVFTFLVQLVTGLFLWMSYSPSSQTAWESVYYIQHEMQFGWLLRGVHHFTAQAMVVLLALHFMQVLIDGAYRAPREVNFWLGLILMQIVLGLSLTGYLLPWDQKGFWATQVATKLTGLVPVVGPSLQRLVVGGSTYGHHTLTRFFAMHAGLLPGLLIFFLILHVYVFRRHGIHVKKGSLEMDASFWPDQVLKDSVACLGVLLVVLLLVFRHAPMSAAEWNQLADEGRLGALLGADLGAPADPAEPYSAARPEWYFLFLFQFLKYFPGHTEIYGAIVIPGVIFGVMFLMPFIGRWNLGHRFNVLYVLCLVAGVVALTTIAIREDQKNQDYQHAVAVAETNAKRIVELIEVENGVGPLGARVMLHNDPKTRGAMVFTENCAQCHSHNGTDGSGRELTTTVAADLGQFGTRAWLKAFLTNPAAPEFYGPTAKGAYKGEPLGTKFTEGEMAEWAKANISKMSAEEIDGVVEFLIAQSNRADAEPINPQLVAAGKKFFKDGNSSDAQKCSECHAVKVGDEMIGDPANGYPQLTGYGSEAWLKSFIADPGAPEHYGERNAMQAFRGQITEHDLDMLVLWMQKRWKEPATKSVAAN